MDYIIHDIKTERQNVSAGLPSAYKLVPAAFYLVAVAAVLLSLYFYLSKKAYETSENAMRVRITDARGLEGQHRAKHQGLISESKEAESIARWLEGARPLQPVTVTIGRSMSKDATIAELALTRDPEIPSNTQLMLKVDGGGSEQIETARLALSSMNYQIVSSDEKKGRDSIDYQGTIIYAE